jgi:alpha-methylacyl-CoA racemase
MSRISKFMKGVRVLDLSRHLPGPLAALFMVDMGAEVLKIESPAGDEVRQLGPGDAQGRSVFFETLNAGKRLLRLDLKTEEGRAELLRLVADADVLIESFRPGVMDRLGVGYTVLARSNPGLIYCSLSGFGRGGPWERRAAHDGNYLALAGVLDRNGASKPMPFEPALADSSGSLFAVIAILGALRAREEDGRGCEIDAALADAAMPLQMLQISEMDATGVVPRGGRGLFDGGTAYYQTYETADGRYVMLGAVEPKFWRAFCMEAGRLDWIARQSDVLPQIALRDEVAAFFKKLTLQECCKRLEPRDCCFSPVLDLKEGLDSVHVQSRGLVRRSDDGAIQALLPVQVDGEPPVLRARAMPAASAHAVQSEAP